MGRGSLLAGMLAGPVAAQIEQPVAVPSRQVVTFHEIITDAPGTARTFRFRFLAPALRADADFEAAERDMRHLCETYALPRISDIGPQPAQIVISLSDRPVEFGVMTPEAIQFFEAYRPQVPTCIWEQF